ncbi:hypothetical protein PPTG_06001 [Phytophthora nicotianae INRA-310]|uniref:Uncharacterized protein n=1 Tax=Phytophthora nicotianae (strain INRA-310) TaxID=761204 RepID=W2QUP0_PHYN3|nr:hypothetical protein PPTG_06001 [Phytophthora nicotianae INRA-310]ETN16907.1 hypothetical protein PPTG_06001 [Phytophthora nicotianae INRA-310]
MEVENAKSITTAAPVTTAEEACFRGEELALLHFNWLRTDELGEIVAMTPRSNRSQELPGFETSLVRSSIVLPPSQRHTGRKTRKEQIQHLQNVVLELSRKLQDLLLVTAKPQVTSSPARSKSPWERLATRELEMRREAERENAKLAEAIAAQKRTIRNIRRLLRRRIDHELLRDLRNAKNPMLGNKEQVFAELLHQSGKVYGDLDKLYAENGMNLVPCPGRTRRLYPDAVDGTTFVEFDDNNHVPFSFARTERAVWEFLQGTRVRKDVRVCLKDDQQADGICKSCVGFTYSEHGLASYILERRVSRKYVEENRTVFVCRAMVEPTTAEHWFSSMRFCETMSIVVRTGDPLSSGQETTIIESHISVSKFCDPTAQQRWPDCVEATADGWESKVSFASQAIENLLFERTLTASR